MLFSRPVSSDSDYKSSVLPVARSGWTEAHTRPGRCPAEGTTSTNQKKTPGEHGYYKVVAKAVKKMQKDD